jgi:hypothetical protein
VTITDPRVDILAEAVLPRWSTLSEQTRDVLRPGYTYLLTQLDAARSTDGLSGFDPDRLRDLLEGVVDHRGSWDNVTDADLAQVQRALLADAAYLAGARAPREAQ